jgi:hypothetical protein
MKHWVQVVKKDKKFNIRTRNMPPVEYLEECFIYDKTSPSCLRWKKRPSHHFSNSKTSQAWNTENAGKPAGSLRTSGESATIDRYCYQVYLTVNKVPMRLFSSRIVYMLHNSKADIANKFIDHKDNNSLNDNIENLRPVDPWQNALNRKFYKHYYPGIKIEKLKSSRSRYRASIQFRTNDDDVVDTRFKSSLKIEEAYLERWKFILSNKDFRESALEYLSDKERSGGYAKEALKALGSDIDPFLISL